MPFECQITIHIDPRLPMKESPDAPEVHVITETLPENCENEQEAERLSASFRFRLVAFAPDSLLPGPIVKEQTKPTLEASPTRHQLREGLG